MILEQNITRWVQLAPNLPENGNASVLGVIPLGTEGSLPGNCGVFPLEIMNKANNGEESLGFSSFQINNDSAHYINMSYTISGYRWYNDERSTFEVSLEPPSNMADMNCSPISVIVSHIWFHKWRDFEIPHMSTDSAMNILVDDSIYALQQNQSVVVSCLSGRGRSGTFSAMIMGKLLKLSSYSDLTEEIVKMRENRDGLVETPAHFRYITRILGWRSPSICDSLCRLNVAIINTVDQLHGDQVFPVIILFLVLLSSTYMFFARKGKQLINTPKRTNDNTCN